jgi:hypothetical protein
MIHQDGPPSAHARGVPALEIDTRPRCGQIASMTVVLALDDTIVPPTTGF